MLKKIAKGPLFLTTALFLATPICMAEVASASSGSSFGLTQPQYQQQTVLNTLKQSLPRTSQGLRLLPFSSIPSLADINTLESNLSTAKSQLATLKNLIPKDPANAQAIKTQIEVAQAKVDSYTSKLAAAKTAYTNYEKATETLANALSKYNTALESETALTTQKTLTQAEYDNLQLILTNKTATLAAANSNLATAKQSKDDAQAALTDATNDLTTAANNHNTATQLLINAQDKYDAAVDAYNTAVRLKANLEQELEEAQLTLSTSNQSKEVKYNNLVTAETNLAEATTNLDLALANKNSAQLTFNQATSNYNSGVDDLDSTISQLGSAQTSYEATLAPLEAAWSAFWQANSELGSKTSNLSIKQTALTNAQNAHTQAVANYNQYLAEYDVAYANYLDKQSAFDQAQSTLQSAQNALNQAQSNYDNNLIPDPNWTAPTRQVEHIRTVTNTRQVEVRTLVPRTETVLQEQVIPNLLPNPTLTSTEGWSGVYPGWQGSQPGMYDGEITFSYMDQTVSQGLYSGPFENATLTLSADWFSDWTADSYSMTVTAEDINRNPVGTATYTNTRTAHDWTNRSVTLEATGPVSYITVSFSGIDHGFWYGMYGPRMKNPALEVSYGQLVTQTVYDEVITYEEETYYTYETYYTTEVIQPQQGLTVRVYNNLPTSNPQRSDTAYNLCLTTTLTNIEANWGGGDILGCGGERVLIHYTGYITPTENVTYLMNQADDGFYMDINGSNVINNWTLKGCGGNWNSVQLQAGQSYAIDAWFFEWGGGACSTLFYQSANGSGVVPASWYSNGASAPLIKDPALLPALQTAQATYDAALADYNTANSDWISAQASQQAAAQQSTDGYNAVINTANILNSAAPEAEQAQSEYDTALVNRDSVWETVGILNNQKTQASNLILSLTSQQEQQIQTVATLLAAKEVATSNLNSAVDAHNSSLSTYNLSVDVVAVAQSNYDLALTNYETAAISVETATTNYETAANNLVTATSEKSNTLADKTSAQTAKDSASSTLETATSTKASAEATLLAATDILTTSQQSVDVASSEVTTSQAEVTAKEAELTTVTASLASAQQVTSERLSTKEAADTNVSESKTSYETSIEEVENSNLPSSTDFENITTIANQEPPVEEGSKEIPAELSSENLMEVNLEAVDPTELTEAQAEQLKEAALETFLTAEEGSPEYEQALEALYLAAEQDDIELPEELATIPGLAGAVEVLNFLGNAGADMSPEVREESKKIVVTAVVAAGVAVQAAAGAATSAAVSAGSSTGSSGSRRVGK